MPRMPRYFVPGVPLHVTQRGNARQALFRAPAERLVFLALLRRAAVRYQVAIHAYVLMTNHVHLLVTPQDPRGVPRLMQAIGRDYVRWFNDKHGRTGTLWEGRYRATAVEDERYLLICMRYIELNPVRAGLVARPEAFPWSSFHSNALGKGDRLVHAHPVFLALGRTREARASAYHEMCQAAIPDDDLARIRDSSHYGWALGGPSFQAVIAASGRRATRLSTGRPRRERS